MIAYGGPGGSVLVDTTVDELSPGDGACSLREAILVTSNGDPALAGFDCGSLVNSAVIGFTVGVGGESRDDLRAVGAPSVG